MSLQLSESIRLNAFLSFVQQTEMELWVKVRPTLKHQRISYFVDTIDPIAPIIEIIVQTEELLVLVLERIKYQIYREAHQEGGEGEYLAVA
jgi:hypothetical protein